MWTGEEHDGAAVVSSLRFRSPCLYRGVGFVVSNRRKFLLDCQIPINSCRPPSWSWRGLIAPHGGEPHRDVAGQGKPSPAALQRKDRHRDRAAPNCLS